MNELNTTTRDLEHSQDIASIDLEQLLTSSLPRMSLLPLVTEKVKLAIAQFVESSPVSAAAGDAGHRQKWWTISAGLRRFRFSRSYVPSWRGSVSTPWDYRRI